jgi:hypothetical protein
MLAKIASGLRIPGIQESTDEGAVTGFATCGCALEEMGGPPILHLKRWILFEEYINGGGPRLFQTFWRLG